MQVEEKEEPVEEKEEPVEEKVEVETDNADELAASAGSSDEVEETIIQGDGDTTTAETSKYNEVDEEKD